MNHKDYTEIIDNCSLLNKRNQCVCARVVV